MAVAVQPTAETKGTSAPAPLWFASLLGALYILGGLAVIFYAVPKAWDSGISAALSAQLGTFFNGALRVVAQIAAAVVLVAGGIRLAGPHPPHGLRGGIFWSIFIVFVGFYLARWVAMIGQSWFKLTNDVALAVFVGACVGVGWLAVRFLRGPRFTRWAVGMEDGGWFRAAAYKRTQGMRVRRMTILGVLLISGAGIVTMIRNGHLPVGENWEIVTPFLPTITLLPDIGLTVPLLLSALALWAAYRIVNNPTFADFLIATEAEMNKVSWTPRRRLIQDTIVVLTTVLILTLFLFLVDMFWGWFLSRSFIGVLPQTKYQYVVTIDKVDPDKADAIIAVLTERTDENKAPAMTPAAARRRVDSAPAPGRNGSEIQPQIARTGLTEEEADAFAHKLREAGADVSVKRSRGKQANDQLRW